MKIVARACGHASFSEFSTDDLTSWKREAALLAGIRYAGV